MAAASFIRAAEDELSCPICFELFVDPNTPKTLPLCGHVCCEVCLKKMVAGKCARNCPECRKIIQIPVDGVESFLTNFRLRNLAEKHQHVGDEKLTSTESTKKPGVRVCPNHDGEKMHYFCCTCNVLACQACLILKHHGDMHNIVGVKEKYEEQKIQMETAIAETNHGIEYASGWILNLNQQLEIVAKKMESVKSARQAALNALENIPDYEYITQHTSLIRQVSRIDLKQDFHFTSHAAANFVTKKHMENLSVGNVHLVTPGLKRKLKLIQTLDGFEDAQRLIAKANDILAVCDLQEVTIYHEVKGKYENKLSLYLATRNHNNTKDIAIYPDGRFVVARGSQIEVYNAQGIWQSLQTAVINAGGGVLCLCVKVTSSGRILSGDFNRSVIREHNQKGAIFRTLKTSIKPWYMTLIHDTHVAISDNKTGKVIVMDLASGKETLSMDIPGVQGVCYDEQTECLLISRGEPADEPGRINLNTGVIEQYSYTTGMLVACLQQGLYHPCGMTMTANGILAVADRKTVKIYQIQ